MQDRFKFRYVLNNEVCEVLAFDISDGIEHKCLFLQLKDGTRKIINDYDWSKFKQSTGLKDKNGKLIYEGDIVKMYSPWDAAGPAGYDTDTCIVKFDKTVCGFTPMCNYDCDCYIYHEAEKLEVIGNIYENLELLESN